MRTLTIRSPAKINLYLNILGKRPDGYHELETVIERVSLFDTLLLRLSAGTAIKLTCSAPSLITNNSIVKAYQCLKDYLRTDFGATVHLEKHIPVGSGLGGASSNAAFFILGALRLLKVRLSPKELYAVGQQVGSDVNFFLSQQPFALCRGRGEIVEPVLISRKYGHDIVFPGIFSSTKSVYAEFAEGACPEPLDCARGRRRRRACPERASKGRVEGLTSNFNGVSILINGLKNNDHSLIENSIFNALKTSAFRLNPRLHEVEEVLQRLSARAYNITGSGSAFFLFQENHTFRQQLYRSCRKRGWMVYRVRTY